MCLARRISWFLILVLVCTGACSPQAKPAAPQSESQTSSPDYNPRLAAHDIEVGKFYAKRGDLDGAIARYKDALQHKANYAEPCLLLGQAYEQKNDATSAIRYYQQYLKILPNASESKKIHKRIEELQEKVKKSPGASGQPRR